MADLAWFDAEKLVQLPQARGMASPLINSAGSVPANIEEGFGRGYGKDYARFLRISLGSTREAQGWYYRARHVFEAPVVDHRLKLTNEIIAGLVTIAAQQRNR